MISKCSIFGGLDAFSGLFSPVAQGKPTFRTEPSSYTLNYTLCNLFQ